MMFRRRQHKMPGLNMTSMPDLIFTVLFFFMIVTHMRSVPLKVKYQVPTGTELSKLVHKSSVVYVFIGRATQGQHKGETTIQINDKYVALSEIGAYIQAEREQLLPEDQDRMTVSLKVDRQTDMGIVADVKQELRKAGATLVNYSATKRGVEERHNASH